jgi:dinuclear metal center YbgI/SA1388 family protein
MQIRELIAAVERTADPRRAASWDRSGVQIAGTLAACDRLAVALDPLPDTIEAALGWGAQCILTHHPLTLSPRLPDRVDDYHRVLAAVLGRGAWLYAAHTSLDVVTDGPAGWLADALELSDRRILEPAGTVPHLQARWQTLGNAAAGRAALAALPHRPGITALALGPDVLEAVFSPAARGLVEQTLATACPEAALLSLAEVLSPATPYGYGLVGALPGPLPFPELEKRLGGLLSRPFFTLAGDVPRQVAVLAYCPGSGADMAGRAFAAGADVYLTGDLKYHQALAVPRGRLVLDVGHFALEEAMMRRFAADLAATFGDTGPFVRYFSGNDPFSAHFPDGPPPFRTE